MIKKFEFRKNNNVNYCVEWIFTDDLKSEFEINLLNNSLLLVLEKFGRPDLLKTLNNESILRSV